MNDWSNRMDLGLLGLLADLGHEQRQARKAAQEAEEIRREAEAEELADGTCRHYAGQGFAAGTRCENCRAGEEDDE